MYDSSSDSVTCTPTLHIGDQTTTLNDITYSKASTPTLTNIDKRYGSVLGGETITFKGDKFSSGDRRFL